MKFTDGFWQTRKGMNARVEIPSLDGKVETTFDIKREGNNIRIQRHGSVKKWNVSLHDPDNDQLIEANETDSELNIHVR